MVRFLSRFWPQSLYRQILLVAALALLCAQMFNAIILFNAERNRSRTESATLLIGRVASQAERQAENGRDWGERRGRISAFQRRRAIALRIEEQPPIYPSEQRDELTIRAAEFLGQQDYGLSDVKMATISVNALPDELKSGPLRSHIVRRFRKQGGSKPVEAIILTARTDNGKWLSAAAFVRPRDIGSLFAMLLQTITLYIAVMIPLALVARRIVKPLERLTQRVRRVGLADEIVPLESEGPADIRNLVDSFNAMQARVSNLLSEKDVMLGAIGHDLKTPLAALRVRVESVENDTERDKMAATIDEMVIILDDILMLARLGKSGEAKQRTDMAALAESVLDEFEMTEGQINYTPPEARLVANVRPVLIRRALRNLVSNAIIHGGGAAVSLSVSHGGLTIYVDDDGPGIADDQIEDMFMPFSRAERSRNRATGGTGLGLTISRAIARSHGGNVTLENRKQGGVRASLTIALSPSSPE